MRWCASFLFFIIISEVIPMDLIEYMVSNGADFDFAVLIAEMYQ